MLLVALMLDFSTVLFACETPADPTPATKYTVEFNTDGGSAVISQEVEAGEKLEKPTDPTKANHTFDGWFKQSTFIDQWNFVTDKVTANTTLYAKWTENEIPVIKYTVEFNTNGGSVVERQEVEDGNKVKKPTDPTKESTDKYDYAFIGWFTSLNGEIAYDFDNAVVTANITLYAKFSENDKLLVYILNSDEQGYTVTGVNNKNATSVIIPLTYNQKAVTSIGNEAFRKCLSLISITIPNSVTIIGSEAFYGCRSLTSITIPNSVTIIGEYAFYNCSSLTNITIPNSVTSIGNYAFKDCNSLTSITIGNSVTSIGDYAFYDCSILTIYAEAGDKPSGWYYSDSTYNWNNSNRPVVWGCTLSEDKSYVVSFIKNASSIDNPNTYEITAPYREGYTFDGWAINSGGTVVAYTAADVNSAPNGTALYAIWTVIG